MHANFNAPQVLNPEEQNSNDVDMLLKVAHTPSIKEANQNFP